MGKRQGLFSTAIQTPRLIPFALLRFYKITYKIGLVSFLFFNFSFFKRKGCGRLPSRAGTGGVCWLVSVTRLHFGLQKSLYNTAKSRITCREGDGWRWDTARAVGLCWPKENRRERGAGGCVWVRRRRRDPGGRLGEAAGMDGDGTGYLKGKATLRSALGHLFFWGC